MKSNYVGDLVHGRVAPARSPGLVTLADCEICSSSAWIMRVSTGPGHTAFTRMPGRATSPAAVLVSPITACFDATQAGMPDVAPRPATQAVLTTAPQQDRS